MRKLKKYESIQNESKTSSEQMLLLEGQNKCWKIVNFLVNAKRKILV